MKTRKLKLPFVLVNMAMTADGKIATVNRAVSSFGSARDHEHLLALRATADAVMAGARTVDSAPINLGPGPAKFRRHRLKQGLAEYPLRVIVSRSGSVNPRAKIFQYHFSPILILTTHRAGSSRLKRLRTVADAVKICGRDEINFNAALRWLRKEWRVKRLLCEGGGELNAALFRDGLVNELHLTICPFIFGGDAPTIAEGQGFSRLADAERFRPKSIRRIGDELFTTFSI
ncbi:MAG TPA: RibD family protein [Candidatus Saccharimonadales bacterium]|nr:RibD family protein [Candidatus Saccharimonadales bacterium]